ncbi:MAG TPA: hypothetical protein VGQ81_16620 [Acidobacteriota bacterium]|jgi:hypothetical protein|nr:hypothetical protein [Acidobacteriota bacterium]
MTFEEFKDSLRKDKQPPTQLPLLLQALWHDANGNWKRAHEIAQDVDNADGAWVHAYLHRKEGDLGNARYWYSRAGKAEFQGALENEWEHVVRALLASRES